MTKTGYSKPALTYEEQVELLVSKGLKVTEVDKVIHILQRISYYRLRAYWYPLLADKNKSIFKPDAQFDSAFKLYCFDRELRALVFNEIEKIEVAVRSSMAYVISHAHSPFWLSDPKAFECDEYVYREELEKRLIKTCKESNEAAITDFFEIHKDVLPPAWMMLEIVSMGLLSKINKHCRIEYSKKVAAEFALPEKVFTSWLHTLVTTRNICAHHSRLWNRQFGISAKKLDDKHRLVWITDPTVKQNRTYYILCIIRYFLLTVNPRSSFTAKVKRLLEKYPEVSPQAMGFPANWKQEPLWQAG